MAHNKFQLSREDKLLSSIDLYNYIVMVTIEDVRLRESWYIFP